MFRDGVGATDGISKERGILSIGVPEKKREYVTGAGQGGGEGLGDEISIRRADVKIEVETGVMS